MIKSELTLETIGKTFADKLNEPIIDVGEIHISRRAVVEHLGCANLMAAARLGRVLKSLHIKSVNKLALMNPLDLCRVEGVGEATMFVAMCLLDAEGFNVRKWWHWDDNQVKLAALQRRARAKGKHDVEAKPRRKASTNGREAKAADTAPSVN